MRSPQFYLSENDLQDRLLVLWRKLLKNNELSIDDDFFEKGGDSLLATELLLGIERITDVMLPESILFESATVRSVADRLTSAAGTDRPVAAINCDRVSRPMVFFHGDYSQGGYFVRNVVKALGPRQALIIVAPHGMGDEPLPETFEKMAADRLPHILELQPEGPYRLCGHCNGALVALETARLLVSAGHVVEWVAMVDAPSFNARRSAKFLLRSVHSVFGLFGPREEISRVAETVSVRTWKTLLELERFWMQSPKQKRMRIKEQRWMIKQWCLASLNKILTSTRKLWGWSSGSITFGKAERGNSSDLHFRYHRVWARYSPAPVSVPIVYFGSQFDGRGWRQISPDVQLVELPGDHYDWVTIHAEILARRLQF